MLCADFFGGGIIPGGRSGARKEVHLLQIRQEWTQSGEQSPAEEEMSWRKFRGVTDCGRWAVNFELPDFEREIPGIRSRAEVLVFVDAETSAAETRVFNLGRRHPLAQPQHEG